MRARSGANDESGFSLIEVVVAMVIFTVMAGSVLGLLIQIAHTTGDNLRRTTASNLASQAIEAVRNGTDTSSLVLGRSRTYPQVNKITYTVTQTTSMADKDSANTICASGSGSTLAYKLVTVEVTWPGMGHLKPVRADTLKAIDTFDSTSTGNVAMSVTGFDGVLADVPVTLTPSTGPAVGPQATGDDGCTFFSSFATGVYTATPNLAGYVGTSNTLSPQLNVSAANPTLVRATLTYAAARSANVALDLPIGSTLVPGVVLQLQGTFMTVHSIPTCLSTTTSECVTGLPGILKNVYPDTYTVKAGTCTETAPSAQSIPLTGAVSALPTVTIPFGAITVGVQTLLGAPVVGRPVTFTHLAPATGCTEPPYSITSVAAGSIVALPYGTWTVATTSVGTGIGVLLSQTVTVGPTPLSRTGTAALKVFS